MVRKAHCVRGGGSGGGGGGRTQVAVRASTMEVNIPYQIRLSNINTI